MQMVAPPTGKGSAKQIWLFLTLAFSWSWSIWIVSGVLPRAGTGAYDFRWLVAQVGVFGPSLAALVVTVSSPAFRVRSWSGVSPSSEH